MHQRSGIGGGSVLRSIEDCFLYTFIDDAYLHGREVDDIATALCEGGSDIIQFRSKGRPVDQVYNLVGRIQRVTDAFGVPLVVNDYVEVARALESAYCHLGQEDFFEAGYRRVVELVPGVGFAPGVGLSTHSPEQAERAVIAGASYLGVGPVFATGTKPTAKPVTVEYVRWASEHLTIPWFAIGGVNLDTLGEVLAAGAKRVCVVSAILNSKDLVGTCQRFKHRIMSEQK